MPAFKYHGPCPDHHASLTTKRRGCKHCEALSARRRREQGKRPPVTAPIFRQLHWPAPSLDRVSDAAR